jgi:signal transduction histidine kinase
VRPFSGTHINPREQQERRKSQGCVLIYSGLRSRDPRGHDVLAHGLLPVVLTRGGLAAGLESIVEGLRVPVRLSVPKDRFPSPIEPSAYFIVAEALTNMAKHSGAQRASVGVKVQDGARRIDMCDDGVVGARPDGRGLLGLRDRVVTLGGDLEVDSPPAAGPRIAVQLPLRR